MSITEAFDFRQSPLAVAGRVPLVSAGKCWMSARSVVKNIQDHMEQFYQYPNII
jgi:hypothetical protein